MRLIADGVIDRSGVPGLAEQLGYSVRQVERLLLAEVGAGPVALARAQRAQTARVLIETTSLPMAEVAFGAGFASIRQFNETIRSVFDMSPSGLRSRRSGRRSEPGTGPVTVRLPFRGPLCPDNLFGHLSMTAVPGVEEVVGTTYRRTLRLANGPGVVALTPTPDHIACRLELTDVADLTTAIARCRRLLDLDADPEAVDRVLSRDAVLAPLVAKAPGRRVPRTVDGAEFAVRAVLGQQVSTAAARTTTAAPGGGPRGHRGRPRSAASPTSSRRRTNCSTPNRPCPRAAGGRSAALGRALATGRLDLGSGADRDAGPGGARCPARGGCLDPRDGGHAGAGRPGRISRRRPRRPAWRRAARAPDDAGRSGRPFRRLASVAGLRRAAPVGGRPDTRSTAGRRPPEPSSYDVPLWRRRRRPCLTQATPRPCSPWSESPIGPLTLCRARRSADQPRDARPGPRRRPPAGQPTGRRRLRRGGGPAGRVLRRRPDGVRRAPRAGRHRVPAPGVGAAAGHPLRRDDQLRRTGPAGGKSPCLPGGGPGQRPEPRGRHRAVSPGRRRRRRPRWLRRRIGPEDPSPGPRTRPPRPPADPDDPAGAGAGPP